MNKLYALLIGINEYKSEEIPNLTGCENDLEKVQQYLTGHYDVQKMVIKKLINQEATYNAIIDAFRSHLCLAGADDTVLIYYCGHGSRTNSAPEFAKYQSDRKDEVLVCHDAWTEQDNILADREIAVLLNEVSKAGPHLVMIADCCNSGSITRDISDCRSRFVDCKKRDRNLASYLNGYFVDKKSNLVPRSTHLLISASENLETAKEGTVNGKKGGFFTQAFIETLTESGGDISYTDLFTRVRSRVQVYIKEAGATSQTPQFENYEGFDPDTLFLTGTKVSGVKTYSVDWENDSWILRHGIAYGLPDAAESEIKVALYAGDPDSPECFGYASVSEAGQKTSVLTVSGDLSLDTSQQYKARIISMPSCPLDIYLCGDKDKIDSLKAGFPDFLHPVEKEIPCKIGLKLEHDTYEIFNRNTNHVYLTEARLDADGNSNDDYIIGQLTIAQRWERLLKLQNRHPKFDPSLFSVIFTSGGKEYPVEEQEIIQTACIVDGEYEVIPYTIKVKNSSTRQLFCILLYFSKDFGIFSLYNGRVEGNSDFVVIDDMHELGLPDDERVQEVTDNFLVIVSTEKLDNYLYEQPGLSPKSEGGTRDLFSKRKRISTWFTKRIQVKTIRG